MLLLMLPPRPSSPFSVVIGVVSNDGELITAITYINQMTVNVNNSCIHLTSKTSVPDDDWWYGFSVVIGRALIIDEVLVAVPIRSTTTRGGDDDEDPLDGVLKLCPLLELVGRDLRCRISIIYLFPNFAIESPRDGAYFL